LPEPPNRIECYDISNTQGTAIVGAMVVFTQGVPDKKLYRKFNIESVVGAPDDFASMEEMLTRRFRRWRAAQEMADQPGAKPDASFSFLPDLSSSTAARDSWARRAGPREVRIAGQGAGRRDWPNSRRKSSSRTGQNPLMLPRHSQGLYLVQRIRDEAHRYGITAHRKKRRNWAWLRNWIRSPASVPARRKALLKHFGSVDKIREASIEELKALVPETRHRRQGALE
jgi:excinuclease ABC subunit C